MGHYLNRRREFKDHKKQECELLAKCNSKVMKIEEDYEQEFKDQKDEYEKELVVKD